MAYCTKADLEAAFGAPKIASWSSGKDAAVQHAIDHADGVIDGYLLSGGYTIPISPVPQSVRGYAVDLAVYSLLKSKGISESEGDKAIISAAKDARTYFEKVGTGRLRIPLPTREKPSEAMPGESTVRVAALPALDWTGYP